MPFGDPIPRINVSRATRRDCDQIFELVNLAFKPEIGKSGIAYRKCDKYRLKDSARKHLEDMWVVKDGRKVCLFVFDFSIIIATTSINLEKPITSLGVIKTNKNSFLVPKKPSLIMRLSVLLNW